MTDTTTTEDITGVLERPDATRPWYKRWTIRGVSLFAVAQGLETSGVLPEGLVSQIVEAAKMGGGILATLGIYRHVANE